jgi:hypothetical protein
LAAQEWAQSFVGDPKRANNSLPFKNQPGKSPEAADSQGHAGNAGDTRTTFVSNPVSRKSVADDGDDTPDYDVDPDAAEHKYRRRGVMQLLVTLGLLYVDEDFFSGFFSSPSRYLIEVYLFTEPQGKEVIF